MAASKRNTVSLILVLALVGGAWAAEPNSPRKTPAPLSNTQYASCIVNITADPEVFPITPQTVLNLIMSSAVGAKAARDELGVNDAAMSKIFQVMVIETSTDSTRPGGGQTGYGRRGPFDRGPNGELVPLDASDAGIRGQSRLASSLRARAGFESVTFRIGVTLPSDVKPAAEEFVRAVVNNLRQSLQAGYRERLDQLSAMIADTDRQRADAQEKLNQLMGVKPGSGGFAKVSLEPNPDISPLKETKRRLENDIQERKMSLVIMEAKRKAIEEQITKLQTQADRRLAEDVVTRELQTLIQEKDKAIKDQETLVSAGRLSPADLADAKQSLTRARIDLARRKEELTKTASGGQLDAYAAQLSQMAIQTAEESVRLDLLIQQLGNVGNQLASANDPSLLTLQVRMAQELVNALDQRMAELKMQQVSTQQPIVTVVGAN